MDNVRKKTAFITALAITASLTACGGGNESNPEDTFDRDGAGYLTETAPAVTVEINTETLASEQQEQVSEIADSLTDGELENKTVKWMAFWDPWHATGSGNSKPVATELFEQKYGGVIEYIPTTWANQANDLSTAVLGGDGIDFVPSIECIPKYVISGMIQSCDDYIDWNSPLWQSVKAVNDQYMIGGKHYSMVCDITEGYVVYYNRSTIESMGFDDPAELYANGEWTLEKFKEMLTEFVDPDAGQYGLDGWFNCTPLYEASGATSISFENGKIVSNLLSPGFERAMVYQGELNKNGLILDKSLFDWNPQIQFIGEGKELFYIGGLYEITSAADIWTKNFGNKEDVMFVPVPRDEKADKYYYNAEYEYCYNICKGAQNPEGVVRLMECVISSCNDPNAQKINDDKYMQDFGWSEEMIEMKHEVKRITMENPVRDLYNGLSSDAASLISEAINKPIQGEDWYSVRDAYNDAVVLFIDEMNSQLP